MGEAALPFLGRADLLERVQGLVAEGLSVVLQGEAGVGKTRLAAEALRGDAAAGRPIDRLLADESRSGVLLGTLGPLGPPASVAVEDQAAVFGWFLRHWRGRSIDGRPVLVWVDDIHHCDPLSGAILRHAVATRTVQLLVTHRCSEPLGDSAQSLVSEGVLLPVVVGPLDKPAASELARAAIQSRKDHVKLDPGMLDRVHELAAGNPLFVRELVAGLNSHVDLRASTTLVSVVERPLRDLSASCRRTLEIIALAEPAPESLLSPRRGDLHLLEIKGLVVRQEGSVRVDHPLRRAWVRRDVGSALADVIADLLELVHTSGCRAEIDTGRLIEWQLDVGLTPDPVELEYATRRAIARRDGVTATRFAAAVRGSQAPLLRGQALVTAGRMEDGLTVLGRAAGEGPLEARAEAAFAEATYRGLMLGDFPGAHAALDAVEAEGMPPDLARHIVAGRLWLWIFGPLRDTQTLRSARDMALGGPDDALTFEVCASTAAVLQHVTNDPTDIEPLIARCAALEGMVSLSAAALARMRALEASWNLSQGNAAGSKQILLQALKVAERDHDLESTALLAGNASWMLALTGRLREANCVGDMLACVPPTDDWYAMRSVAELVHNGNRWLVEQGSGSPGPSPGLADGRVNLERLFATRAEILRSEANGSDRDDERLHSTLRLLVAHRKHLWAALFGLEVTDSTTSRAVHELLWRSSQQVSGSGMVAVAGAVARARLQHDGASLLRGAHDLEWAGLHAPAMRVFADASAVCGEGTAEGTDARAGVLRTLREYDGRYPQWLETVDGLPTPRQMEIAWRVVDGAGATEVADELFLSARTVENHLLRVYRALQVHGREELGAMLRLPPRPSQWRPGDY